MIAAAQCRRWLLAAADLHFDLAPGSPACACPACSKLAQDTIARVREAQAALHEKQEALQRVEVR